MRVRVLPATKKELAELELLRRTDELLAGVAGLESKSFFPPGSSFPGDVWLSVRGALWCSVPNNRFPQFPHYGLSLFFQSRGGRKWSHRLINSSYGVGLSVDDGQLVHRVAAGFFRPATKVIHESAVGVFLQSLIDLDVVDRELFYELPLRPHAIVEELKYRWLRYEYRKRLRRNGTAVSVLVAVEVMKKGEELNDE